MAEFKFVDDIVRPGSVTDTNELKRVQHVYTTFIKELLAPSRFKNRALTTYTVDEHGNYIRK